MPTAQGWDKIQTIDSLLRKGGWRGQVLKFCGKANFHLLVHLRSPPKFVARSDWSDTSLSWSLSPTKTTCNTAGNLMSSHSQFCWFGAHCTTSPGFFQFVLVGYITTSHYRGTPPRSRSQGEHWQEFPAAQAFQVCVLHSHFLILLTKCSSDVVTCAIEQVPYGAVQYSTRLPPDYQPPIYCSAPGKACLIGVCSFSWSNHAILNIISVDQVTPCALHTATPYHTHHNTTNRGIQQILHLGCSTRQTSKRRTRSCQQECSEDHPDNLMIKDVGHDKNMNDKIKKPREG